MAERIFTVDDITGARPVCGCVTCALGAVFAEHLTALRTGHRGKITVLGHRGPAQGTTAVPHFLAVDLGGPLQDVVVWEEMRRDQLAAWLPSLPARARVPRLATRIPRLVRVRQAIRTGAFTPSGQAGADLASGRYPSFRFLVEHWPDLNKEFTP
ncbi:hypothetical protein ACIBEA_39645 [Streptomyces sp. NPDC051555]|uniref:hypothetical protein n=1 Tax=Streptomyces sp. NPDC051555 TaxID=3365657 RepID=UPI0037BBB4ED